MRIWDINPGYLNQQTLLVEHSELHGVVSIIVNRNMGYSKHPGTVRWTGYGWALRQRHKLLTSEMSMIDFTHKSPVFSRARKGMWPQAYVDEPFRQFQILESKRQGVKQGRIPLPKKAQKLWIQHKYSILARDVNLYRELGRDVSRMKPNDDFSKLAKLVTEMLRKPSPTGGLSNALQHMWWHG